MTDQFELLPPLFENMPEELKTLDKWVLWKAKLRDGRITKIPYSVTGLLAKTNDPSTWSAFEQVKAAYQSGGFHGVGFVLDGTDGVVGVDLDKINEHRNQPEVVAIIRRLKGSECYLEASPSGKGLRAFLFGTIPFDGTNNRELGVELYQKGRYLTVTGHVLKAATL